MSAPRPKVLSVFGTRPEAIKMAPVVRELAADWQLEHRLVVTAQHRELLDEVLELFDLAPAHDLNLMQQRQSLEYLTSAALTGLSEVLAVERPDFVLVHGDTTTTFVAALAAFYQHIPVGHVEAGLRTSTIKLPFPEELNRRVTDLLADHYYCPTSGAAANLRSRAEHNGQVFITGNTALDAVRLAYHEHYTFTSERLAEFAEHDGPKLLLTAHRRENWGAPLEQICYGLLDALTAHPAARACFCWHPNPAVRDTVRPLLAEHPRVLLVDPPRYDEFVNLMARSDLLLSDSGGIQEEVTQLRRFVLVLRQETERPEAVASGFARVIGTAREAIATAVAEVLPQCLAGSLPPPQAPSPFGDGHAADVIHAAVRYAVGLEHHPPEDYHGA
jgi:UDP-N-acetylglucosamine 2-epimerase (non-hydrolysing)